MLSFTQKLITSIERSLLKQGGFFLSILMGWNLAEAVTTGSIRTATGELVNMSAQSMIRDTDRETVDLKGQVLIGFEGQTISCDEAHIDNINRVIKVSGNLVIASPTAYVEGDRAEMSMVDNTGTIYNGYVKSGQVIFDGEIIKKTGKTTYEATKGSFTACTSCPPSWRFSGDKIRAELGGYAHIKSTWIRFGDIPFLWLPYLIVPLKSERQSGLLVPTIDVWGDEIGIGVPVFWAISRSQDLTFHPKYYFRNQQPQRGFKTLTNYRYVISDDSSGELNFGWIPSDAIFVQENEGNTSAQGRSSRWSLNHDHIYQLPGGFSNKIKLNLASDLRYPRDFRNEVPGLGEAALENRISLTKNSDTLHSSIDASYYINQLKLDPLDGNSDAVHRFPEIRFASMDRSLFGSRLFFKSDINYSNFVREEFGYDDVVGLGTSRDIDRTRGSGLEGSGRFDPDIDQVRTGQRIDLRPELSAPFRIAEFIDVLPAFEFRHTQYAFNVNPDQASGFDTTPFRQYMRARLSIRTQLGRTYELKSEEEEEDEVLIESSSSSPEIEFPSGIFALSQVAKPAPKRPRLRHEIEPEFVVAGIPWFNQSRSRFFGSNSRVPIFLEGQPVSDSDFRGNTGIQFDYADRILQRNAMRLSINNTFVKKSFEGSQPSYERIASVRFGTSYDLDEASRTPEPGRQTFPWGDVFSLIDVRRELFDTSTLVQYFPIHRVANTSSRIRFNDGRNNFIQVSIAQTHLITENISEAYPKREENLGIGFGINRRYFSLSTQFDYLPERLAPLSLRVKSWSAILIMTPPGDCWGLTLRFNQAIGEARPIIGFSFDYNFGGTS